MYLSLYFFLCQAPRAAASAPCETKGWEWWHSSGPRLCRQGQRRGRGCGCTKALLGAKILTHSSVSVVGAVPQQAPVLEFFAELFLIRDYPLTSLYNSEAGIVQHTWSIAHSHTVAAGVVQRTDTTKLAPKGINCEIVLRTIL